MNTEVQKEETNTNNKDQSAKKGFKKNRRKNKKPRVFVTYGQDELKEVEKEPFWNIVHDAVVKDKGEDGIVVSIAKGNDSMDVFVPYEELSSKAIEVDKKLRIYLEDEIKEEDAKHPFVGSEIKAIDLDLLNKGKQAFDNNEDVLGYVIGEIKGGYCISLFSNSREEAEKGHGVRAFLPQGRAGLRRTQGLKKDESPLIKVKISEYKPELGNIIVSRREVLQQEKDHRQKEFFEKHSVGDVVEGEVTALMPYGAFIDLGFVDGFLHVSDIGWGKKPRLKEQVPVGKIVKAKIIELDEENHKVKLSIKDLNEDPWQNIEKIFKPGSEVTGTIVAFADFGAFVRLKDGVEGLIHLGEITWNRIKHPSQHFNIGDEVKALVLRVDKEARRISLSTKAVEKSPVERLSEEFPVGTVIKTKISSIHDFGMFVELDEETNGLVPRSEISWVRLEEPLEKMFKEGQELEVAVMGYEPKRQRVTCSLKRVKEDPWPKIKAHYKRGSVHKAKVEQVNKTSVVVELEEGILAICPKSELLQSSRETQRYNVRVGDEMQVLITVVDPARGRIIVSQKGAVERETKSAYQDYLSKQKKSGGDRVKLGDALKGLKNKK